jgi:hypothetical protein
VADGRALIAQTRNNKASLVLVTHSRQRPAGDRPGVDLNHVTASLAELQMVTSLRLVFLSGQFSCGTA